MKKSNNVIAIAPGETIKEQLVERGMKQKEFAVRMGMSEKHISKLINGEVQLTIEMARKLEMVLGAPTQFWCNLETIYREDLIRIKEEKLMSEDVKIAQMLPYKQMAEKGWVIDVTGKTEQVIHLRKYFELVELKLLQSVLIPRIACRHFEGMKEKDFELIAWAQKAKIEARNVETKSIDIKKLNEKIVKICEWLREDKANLDSAVKEVLSECGIALVVLPRLGNEKLHGATFIDGKKIVLGLSLSDDIEEMYFSLFHEIAHIIYGHIEFECGTSEDDEHRADEYAKEMVRVIKA